MLPPLLAFLICLSSSVFNCVSVSGAPLTRSMTPPSTSQVGPHAQCLTHISPEEKAEFERGLIRARSFYSDPASGLEERDIKHPKKSKKTKHGEDTDFEKYTFNVSFNVVFTNETREGGWVPDKDIQAQINVLNADYNSTGISFVLIKTARIKSPDWFANVYPGSAQEQAMKRIYNIGDASTLNVYTLTFNSTTKSLGASSIPSAYYRDPMSDGVIIRHSTVTNGPRENYNLGRTLVHEVGHWLGLFHTFEGGCDDGTNVGDNIADTPPQASGSEGCPVGRDSCPGDGPDLINNFMDYSFDACMTSFTNGQAARMRESAKAFRRPGVIPIRVWKSQDSINGTATTANTTTATTTSSATGQPPPHQLQTNSDLTQAVTGSSTRTATANSSS